MNYKLEFSKEADDQVEQWGKSGAKKDLEKIIALLKEIEEHPATGTGQVEQLRYNLTSCWSRRINKQFRIIYRIREESQTVEIISLRSHYGQK
jgi:toxin YoeB